MSPFGSPDSKSLWEDVKLEWKGVVFMAALYFLFPTVGASFSGDLPIGGNHGDGRVARRRAYVRA